MSRNAEPRPDYAIVVRNGLIDDLGTAARIIRKYPRQKPHLLDSAVILPGLVNLHAHLELPPLLETVRAKTFPGWLLNLIRTKRSIMPYQYKEAARRNIETLAATGTTTVGEICTHGASPRILKKSSLRCVIYNEVIGMNPAANTIGINCPSSSSPLLRYGLSPHSPYTVSASILRRIGTLSVRRRLCLAMHVAESADETRLLQRKKNGLLDLYNSVGWSPELAPAAETPFTYLKNAGVLGPEFLAVHAVHVTLSDIDLLRQSGTPVAHCPRSNAETHVGRMPLKKLLEAGVTVGLGTDSLASVPTLSMWDEMRYAYETHRRSGIHAEEILRLATVHGAKALGLGGEIGTIERGKKADIIAVPLPSKNTGDLYSDLLRETKSCIMNMVNGKIVYRSERTPSEHN